MKKKLLLFLTLVAVMTCIFAVSALAAEIPDWTDITTVDGMPDKSVFGADGTKETRREPCLFAIVIIRQVFTLHYVINQNRII